MSPNFRKDFDVIVVGGGIAGSSAALELDNRGMRVAMVDKQITPPRKSLFINGDKRFPADMLDWLSAKNALIPCPDFLLINADNVGRNLEVRQKEGGVQTYAVFHGPIIKYLREGFSSNIDILTARVVRSVESPDGVELGLDTGNIITGSVVVDATGNYSQLSRIHKTEQTQQLLADDPIVLWVKGVRAYGNFLPGQLIDPIGREIGLSWVLPYTGDYGDVIAADYSKLSEINPVRQTQTFENLVQFCKYADLCTVKAVDSYFSSFIRCQPIPKHSVRNTRRLFAVGEAAGMGSPLMAEVVPAALYWGGKLAEFIEQEKSPWEFYDAWRRQEQIFPYDLELAMLKRRIRREAVGEYGSNAPIYQQILSGFPPEIQRQILTERRIPLQYMPSFLGAAITNVDLLKNMVELSWDLIKVKMSGTLAS